MGLLERVGEETAAFHGITDEDVFRLLGPTAADGYCRYLVQMYGFIRPLECSISSIPDIGRYIDIQRDQKGELLRRDLSALHLTAEEIAGLPRCAVPAFTTVEEALGWAYPIERSTLRHGERFRYLATVIPGDIAFASSYLKCYAGIVGEAWRGFGNALMVFESMPRREQLVIDSARKSFQCLRAWRFVHETRSAVHLARTARMRLAQLRIRKAEGAS
jgi:heme oxygenase (biliverdin-IX-beta and delta-forming)